MVYHNIYAFQHSSRYDLLTHTCVYGRSPEVEYLPHEASAGLMQLSDFPLSSVLETPGHHSIWNGNQISSGSILDTSFMAATTEYASQATYVISNPNGQGSHLVGGRALTTMGSGATHPSHLPPSCFDVQTIYSVAPHEINPQATPQMFCVSTNLPVSPTILEGGNETLIVSTCPVR